MEIRWDGGAMVGKIVSSGVPAALKLYFGPFRPLLQGVRVLWSRVGFLTLAIEASRFLTQVAFRYRL